MLEIVNLRTQLLGPVSLAVGAGECVAILGPSGSGKSLFLRAVVDLDPNQGCVKLEDRRRDDMPADQWRRLVAMVPAESGWWSEQVADHFAPNSDANSLLDAVGLPDAMGWEVSRLSSGERQRLAIARALSARPSAILLDEPTAMLDQVATKMVEDLVRSERERGVPIVIVTHDQKQAERLAARRFAMRHGQLQLEPGVAA
ncbi:MAG: ABC transporter ATP-binding protein [Geminicoccaceae bacterium]